MHAPLRALLCALPLLAYAASSTTPAYAYDDAGYLAYADRMQERLDALWDDDRGIYRPPDGGVDVLINANLLLTHSVAARWQHRGPSRSDDRARRIAEALVSAPVFTERPVGSSQAHGPGWSGSIDSSQAWQHVMVDAEVVDGLVHAWKARHALRLPGATARRIADRIHRVARSPFWRFPRLRLNQINWYALVYAADATVSGSPALLRQDLRAHVLRFVNGARNLMAGLRFQYLPQRPAGAPANVDSAEYANIVLSFLRFYDQARRAGMRPPPPAGRGLIRRWIRRVIAGYWTHGGYLNWDSGLGFKRWHRGDKLTLAHHGLIGIAQTPRLQPWRRWGRWSKWMFDRALRFYERLAARDGGLPQPVLFDLHTAHTLGSARLTAARHEGNAARALDAGLGRMAGRRPPSLYAFDPDIGRLAVTTPRYNTAIIATNQRAFPYGGIELARLFDGEQDVAAGIGGHAPAAFGMLVRAPSGRRIFSSQTARTRIDPRVTPLRLTRAPSGTGASVRTRPGGKVFAGPFRDLRARGVYSAGRFRAVTAHRFTRDFIETSWRLDRLRGHARLHADALMPSWGGESARVVAVLRDGSRVRVGAHAVALARVRHFEIVSRHSGYTVTPRRRPPGAVARVLLPARQSSAPDPGPTLAVELARGASWRRATFAVRIVITRR